MRRAALACLLAVALPALVAAGCGSSDSGDGTTATEAAAAPPASKPQDFPSAKGKTLQELAAGMPEGPQLAPAVAVLDAGGYKNRFGFGLFDGGGKQIGGATVALYVADARGQNVKGPYSVSNESLAVKPQFASRQTAEDPDSAKAVYVSRLPFAKNGKQQVMALARLDGRLVATPPAEVVVGAAGPPRVGQKAPKISTPTVASVGGDAASIDTRIPPGTMHEVDFADVVGKEPIVLVFATPALCQSRVCGPIVDVAEQVKAATGDRANFIHMEIYEGNDFNKGFREQVRAYGLPTEPWTFAINKQGKIVDRIEGAASVREMQALADKAAGASSQ